MPALVLAGFGLWGTCTLGVAQTIPNPSFEANSFTNGVGYISSNAPIAGWTTTDTNLAGLNPAASSPFANNGVIPNGTNVAFIQSGANSSLSTVISNLTVGQTYKVNFRVNARAGELPGVPNLKVSIAGTNVINSTIANVEPFNSHTNQYQYFAFDFTAAATNQIMTLSNDASGDHTVLVDNFSIAVRNSGWSYAVWTNDASSGLDGTKVYTHAYRFGITGGATINGVVFTGIGGGNPSNSVFSTTGLPNFSSDANDIVGASQQLATNFLWGNGAPESITLNGLKIGNSYVATLYSVGYENGARAATFSVGNDRLTVNQDQFNVDIGIRVSYAYTASAKSLTLTYVPLNSGFTFHTYGFSNAELTNVYAAFLIVTNLADSGPGTLRQVIANASPGETVTFDPALSGKTNILTDGELLITYNLTIDASALPGGFKISGNTNSRVFEVADSVVVTLNSLTIQDGLFDGYGGGIYVNSGASLTLTNCTLSGNSANNGYGGGIYNSGGTLTINGSTFSGNSANGSVGSVGGGIFNANGGTLTINGSTFSGNSANGAGGVGGGIYNGGATLTINGSTFSGNSANGPGGGGGGIFSGGGTLTMTNTIVAGNSAPSSPDIFISGPFSGTNNLTNGTPLLASLGNYGGPTQTMPPLTGSPAIDAGLDSITNSLSTDQRGFPRLSGAHVDIGAVEVQFVAVPTNNRPVLKNVLWSSVGGTNTFRFSFTNTPGADFTALASTNLSLPLANWTVLGNIPEISSGQYQFTDSGTTNFPQRFYKVVSP